MRVCNFITRYLPVFSGQALQIERIGRPLRKLGVETFVISYRFKGLFASDVINGVPVFRISPVLPGKLGTVLYNLSTALMILKYRKDFDILHVHSIAVGKYSALLTAKLLGKKAVFEMVLVGSDDPQSVVKHSPMPALETKLFGLFDRYIAISEALANSYKRTALPPGKLRLLQRGVDTTLYAPAADKSVVRTELGLPEDRPLVCFVGAVLKRKGVDLLMEAWKQVVSRDRDAILLVVGPDSFDEMQRHLDDYARETKELVRQTMEGRVIFTGMTDKVDRYLKASDVFVFPSRAEGMPNSPLEALSCGLPCVLTDMEGITEHLIEDGDSGTVVPQDDVDALAEALLALLRDPEKAAAMGRKARERALSLFPVEKAAEDLSRCYQETLRGQP